MLRWSCGQEQVPKVLRLVEHSWRLGRRRRRRGNRRSGCSWHRSRRDSSHRLSAPAVGKVEALRLGLGAHPTIPVAEHEVAISSIWQVPVPGVLPSWLLASCTGRSRRRSDSVGHGQGIVEQQPLVLVDDRVYLRLDGVQISPNACLRAGACSCSSQHRAVR